MSETANKMYLEDESGNKILPRTLIDCVQDEDGNSLQNYINDAITVSTDESEDVNVETYIDLNRNDIADNLTTEDNTKVLSASQGKVLNDKVEEVSNIAKGRNRAHVFSTTEAMQTWLSDEANKGLYNVGDNLYIVDVDVPDWWISAVLDTADAATGYYYNIAQLETQKVDLTEIQNEIDTMKATLETVQGLRNKAIAATADILCNGSGSADIDTSELGNPKAFLISGYCNNINTGSYSFVVPHKAGIYYFTIFNTEVVQYIMKVSVAAGNINVANHYSKVGSNNTTLYCYVREVRGIYL